MRYMATWAVLSLAIVLVCAPTANAGPDEAAQKFAQGKERLAKSDFDGALRAYQAAAKKDSDNPEYAAEAAVLQRVIQTRRALDSIDDPAKWLASAESLHTFYNDNQLYGEALPPDRKIHARFNSADSATMLARTQLALGMNSEAAELLRSLPPDAAPDARVLLALALARQGQTGPARAALADWQLGADAPATLLLDLARVYALLRDSDRALDLLTRGFEATPPTQLDLAKTRAKTDADLASLKDNPDFAKALATESKVAQSKCSTGAACGKCPSRKTCSADEPKKDEPKSAPCGKDDQHKP